MRVAAVLHEGRSNTKSQKKIYSIFPRLSAKQLKSQAMGGGSFPDDVQQENIHKTKYQPAIWCQINLDRVGKGSSLGGR